jgi:hypothetical protein
MSTNLRLHTLFATLLGTAAVAVGCSGAIASTNDTDGGTTTNADGSVSPDSSVKADGGGPDASLPAFDTTVCLDDSELNYLFPKDATLTIGVDFLGGYQVDGQSQATGTTASPHKVGAACSRATDAKACTTELASFEPKTPSWGCNGFCPPFPAFQVRTTSGDKVAVIGQRENVQKAFLPIDKPSEAVAAVAARFSGLDCQKPNVLVKPDGTFVVKTVNGTCTPNPLDPSKSFDTVDEAAYLVTADGTITEIGRVRVSEVAHDYGCPIAGRKPEGLVPALPGGDCVGGYFAKMAHLEAASVLAFAHMVEELEAHGAPAELCARARAAIADEERHAACIGVLAAQHGSSVPRVEVSPMRIRSLLEMAIDNRREGCVRETFGALVAHYQAETSTERTVRDAMKSIATDETNHAALSWDLDAWFATRLDETERALVEAAGREALLALEDECAHSLDEGARSVVGLPSRGVGLELLAGMSEGLGLAVEVRTRRRPAFGRRRVNLRPGPNHGYSRTVA